jgi:predicted HicB family RNase H-like nuclease
MKWWSNGRRFSVDAWKEHFVRKYVGTRELILPTGEIITQRKSTTELNVEEYSALIDKTLAELAVDHGFMSGEMAA